MSRIYTDLAVSLVNERGIVVRDLFGTDLDRLEHLIETPRVDRTLLTGDPRLTFDGTAL